MKKLNWQPWTEGNAWYAEVPRGRYWVYCALPAPKGSESPRAVWWVSGHFEGKRTLLGEGARTRLGAMARGNRMEFGGKP